MRAAWAACPRGRRYREREPFAALRTARDDGKARLTFAIYLARHGETEWSANGRHTGRTDLPLTPQGEKAAATLRPRLSGIDFAAVYSSPMQRARKTAAIAGFPDAMVTPLLQEYDYGAYEGMTSAAIQERRPGWELYRDGCPDGETPAQVYARASEFVALASATSGPVLAFAHGHILRAVAVAWVAFDIAAAARFELDVATLSILTEDRHGREVKLWNAP